MTPQEIAALFISDGISNGGSWGTYRHKANGSLKRVVSCHLPLRDSKPAAENDLANWLYRLVWLKGSSTQRQAAVAKLKEMGRWKG